MPGYRHPGDVPSQEEVLAGLHAEIAAKSPWHAALVALYEEARAARIAAYSAHRDAGLTRAQAAARVGVGPGTAGKYEQAYWDGEADGL